MEFSASALRYWMGERGIDERELANRSSIDTRRMIEYVEGAVKPQAATIAKIATFLNVNPVLLTDYAYEHGYERIDKFLLTLQARVYAARINNGWTRKQLAQKAKTTESMIADIENGVVKFLTGARRLNLDEALGLDVNLMKLGVGITTR